MEKQVNYGIRAETLFTSHEAGSLLQVDPTSVNNWIKAGRITAFRTPGGHRRIRAGDLVRFLEAAGIPIPRDLAGISRPRLLIVDDDARQLASLRRLLKSYQDRVNVSLVDNGIDALVQVGAFTPRLVVLDVFMPGVDGIEVCRRLKASAETRDIKIVMVSGQLTEEVERRALAAGAYRCVAKPLDLDAILAILEVNEVQPAREDR